MHVPSLVCHRIFWRRPRKYKIMRLVLNNEIMVNSTYHYHKKFQMWVPCCRACMNKDKFFILEGQLYQERLVFNYFKNNPKRYLENKGNAYSSKKTPRASRVLRWALNPSLLELTSFTLLYFAPSATFPNKILAPLITILGWPLKQNGKQ